jgi:hypothetical protein
MNNMHLLSSIGLSIVGYFILMYITTYLTGMVIRGFFCRDTDFEDFVKKGRLRPHTKMKISIGDRTDKLMTIQFSIITILFLYLLYHYLNVWTLIAALLLIFSRVPDLIWEIRNGKKVTANDRPRGGFHSVTDITMLIGPLIFWWSIYNL